MTLQIKGLSHITFFCKDLEKTAEMFEGVFGAQEVYSSGDNTFSISKEKFLPNCAINASMVQFTACSEILFLTSYITRRDSARFF